MTETATRPFDPHPHDWSPWGFWRSATEEEQRAQRAAQARLAEQADARFGERCFVSELAAVQTERLVLGDDCYVAAHAYVTGTLEAGRHCTINPFTVVRGDVRLGDAVRIGAHTSLLGFNHTMTDPDVEVFRQPLTSRGIRIGDDVWIGSHVVVVDGVSVGDKAMLAAGAVVTRDVPAGAVMGGNPARVLRWRVPPADGGAAPATVRPGGAGGPGERLVRFAERARAQAGDVLARCWRPDLAAVALDGTELGSGMFLDRPGAALTLRAQCDAVEVADLLLGRAPDPLPAAEHARRLRARQDPATGWTPLLDADGRPDSATLEPLHGEVAYHVLCVGYALDVLGSGFEHPLRAVAGWDAAEVVRRLADLPWERAAWGSGAWVDMLGTALRWNLPRGEPGPAGAVEALVGWLVVHADPRTGMWGRADVAGRDDGLLQVVNGFYRASRGTFAQHGLPLPHPERVVDTVLGHARDPRWFAPERRTACNVLDVAHPLWLAGRQTDHRGAEVRALAARLLEDALSGWVDGEGFGFRAPHASTAGLPATRPGLQGTEMWLAIVWLLADLVGMSEALAYRPRGVHRPEPALGASDLVSATVGALRTDWRGDAAAR